MNDVNLKSGSLQVVPGETPMNGSEFRPGADVERAIEYWRDRLAGIPAILELPTDRPRPPAQSFRAARESAILPESLVRTLEAWGEREGASLFALLLAAFQTLLTRYTRQDDIVVGSILPGQEEGTTDGVIGPFDIPLPIRTDMSGDPTFRELLAGVNDALAGAREHRNIPWALLVEAVQAEQDASRHPVYQAAFSFEDARFLPEQDWSATDSAADTLKVDLQLQLCRQSNGMVVHFTYSTDLFDAGTIVRMAGHFQQLLQGIAANPYEKISRLPLLTEAERHQLVVEWNDTAMEYPKDRCVHQLFEAQAAKTPDAIAVMFEGQRLTYRELDQRANQLARHLISLGARPDGLIGICLERSLEMIVGVIGILKAGSAYVPLDPAYPRDRIAFMLENSEVPLLLTQTQLADTLPKCNAKVVLIDAHWPEIARQSPESPALSLDPENRAYVIYTSGSTGKPKGVEIPHRAVVNLLTSMIDQPGFSSSDRLLAVTTLSFDIAGIEIHLPLTRGASFEIVSREVAADGNRLLAKLGSSGATVLQATPATFRMLLEAGWAGDRQLKIIIGGEAVSHKLASQLLERAGSVWNQYGPTETTIWSTGSKLEVGQGVTIGRPFGNTETFILDTVLQPVPIGVAGELHIGGDGLARGYLKRRELTAEKFIAHPLSADPKARLYKTGDLVRYLPNGKIEFLGRIDHQVKIRGFRIELGEIEAVLRQHPRINDTVVVAREDVPGDKRVVAYVVPAGEPALTTAELRTALKEKLPEYMVPSIFVTLKSLPLTPNGKVDRRALPAPTEADLTPVGMFAAPRDAVESRLAQIWETVLGVRPIGVTDNYFDLGGHSILAVKLMHHIEEAFGKNLPIATLLQAPTIEQLAAILRQKEALPAWSCLVPIQTAGSRPPFFCIHGANGAVVRFHALSRYLGADQPFYGLQAQGLGAGQSCHGRTEEMAAHYIKEVRKVQLKGPYFLGGYSFGGAIAFEMAQQLSAQGHGESVVVLFDTNFPQSAFASVSASAALLEFFRAPVSKKPGYLWRILTVPLREVERRLQVARLPENSKKVRKACLQAERDYRPQAYSGRVILYRSNHKPLGQLADPRAGWSNCAARGLEIREVAGNHENILLEPQVRGVAESLKAWLDETRVSQQRTGK